MPFVWFMCPETTGKSLEEVDLLFAKEKVKESILAEQIVHGNEVVQGDGDEKSSSMKMEEV